MPAMLFAPTAAGWRLVAMSSLGYDLDCGHADLAHCALVMTDEDFDTYFAAQHEP